MTARKPAGAIERDALGIWQQARPSTAMTMLANAGYGETRRAEFLRRVVRLPESEVTDFASPAYVTA
jgi:hypothetical protein